MPAIRRPLGIGVGAFTGDSDFPFLVDIIDMDVYVLNSFDFNEYVFLRVKYAPFSDNELKIL